MRPRVLLLLALGAGAAATVLVGLSPGLRFAYNAPSMHVFLETAAALAALLVAYLVVGRAREHARFDDILLVAGLALLGLTNLFYSALPLGALGGPAVFTTWAPLVGRLQGTLLTAAAAIVPQMRVRQPGRAIGIAMAGVVVVLAANGATAAAFADYLPPGVNPNLVSESRAVLTGHPVVAAVQFISVAVYLVGAAGFLVRSERTADELRWWLALGMVFGAVASLNYGLYPSLYSEWVYTGDIFRLVFYLVLLIGAARVIRTYWRNLASSAVLEERRRLARDLHDGVAQELAFIARRARRLRDEDAGPAFGQIAAAADRALADSRLAIAALTRPMDEPLDQAVGQAIEDTASRLGATVDVDLVPGVVVPPATRDALIRIAIEAVSNAARHAGAGRITVSLTDRPLALRISDDGAGFDPGTVATRTDSGFGLVSMRERAAALDASFRITSQPGEGTQVEVVLP